jgi:hypothetical protein
MVCVQNFVKRIFGWPRKMWVDNIRKNLKEIECEHKMDGTDSGACPIAGFAIMSVEPSCSASLGSFTIVGVNIIGVELLGSATA